MGCFSPFCEVPQILSHDHTLPGPLTTSKLKSPSISAGRTLITLQTWVRLWGISTNTRRLWSAIQQLRWQRRGINVVCMASFFRPANSASTAGNLNYPVPQCLAHCLGTSRALKWAVWCIIHTILQKNHVNTDVCYYTWINGPCSLHLNQSAHLHKRTGIPWGSIPQACIIWFNLLV